MSSFRRSEDPIAIPRGLGMAAGLALAVLLVPLVALVVRAPWVRLVELLGAPTVRAALFLSLVAPTIATAAVVLLGIPLAWVLARRRLPAHRLVRALVLLPMVLPPVVGGVALLLSFGRRGLVGRWFEQWFGLVVPFSTLAVVVAAVFVALPFFVVSVEAGFAAQDRRRELAVASFGASPWRVLWLVTLPSARPALVAGAGLAWARALGEFGATITFAGNLEGSTQTMPLAVYVLLQQDPDAAIALSLVLLAISIAVLVRLSSHLLPGQRATTGDSTGGAPADDRPTGATAAEPNRPDGQAAPAALLDVTDPAVDETPPTAGTTRGHVLVDVTVQRPHLDVQFTTELGSAVTALVGPNGAGKSTVLHALAGTLDPRMVTGTISGPDGLLDRPGVHVPLHRRNIGILFQDPVLLDHRSLLDNVAMAVARGGRVRPSHRDRARQELALVGLHDPVISSHPHEVSGGQAQRAGLARALAGRPDLVLLDEPLAAVDASGRASLRTVMRARLRAAACPTLVVTHDLSDVAGLADDVIVLEAGGVTARGTIAELSAAPPSPFTADLFDTNLVTGTADGTNVSVDDSDDSLVLHTATVATGRVQVAWSPRAVALYDTPPAGSPRNTLPGRVIGVEDLGDLLRVQLDVGVPIVATVTPDAARDLAIATDRRLVAVVKATELRVRAR